MCKCINENCKAFRVKVQFFSPDRVPTARGEFTEYAESVPKAILKRKETLKQAGYNESEYVVYYIEVQNEN